MNPRHPGSDGAGGAEPVDLAGEPPFALAHLAVTPAALTVAGGGWSHRLEPRAMQVLVALARAGGAVVGRTELNARVWGGRVVGDDAINRAVQLLRRVAADAPPPAPFRIETVPRVGYRLLAADGGGAAAAEAPPDPRAPARPGGRAPAPLRRSLLAAAAAGAVLVAGVALVRPALPGGGAADGWTVGEYRMLDDLPPEARDVALSPDGRLAYRGRDAQGRDRVFVRAAGAGGAGEPVSPPFSDARGPAWSPDGAVLAFSGYDPGRPCRLFLWRGGGPARAVGGCETARDPRLAWTPDGGSLLFGDAPGWNAVPRVTALRLADGRRDVLSSPPGDGLGDDLPVAVGRGVAFRRQYGWADEGWVLRDPATGRERLLWRRRGVAGSSAAALPDGAGLAIAWTGGGASGLDLVGADGRAGAQPVALGPVAALSAAGPRLLVELDRTESALIRARDGATLAKVRGRIAGPAALADGGVRFPVAVAGASRIMEVRPGAPPRPWGRLATARISGLEPSPDGRLFAALVTEGTGRAVVVLDGAGDPVWRWAPRARSVNPAAWTGDGRRLVAPVLDGAGWRLFGLDPMGGDPPRELGPTGFALVQGLGPALYAVRAGENVGGRELWRLDGTARRLPVDLTLADIVNWRAAAAGVWLPDRADRDRPRLVLRDARTGRALRALPAPGLAGPGAGLAADADGPIYVGTARDAPEYGVLSLRRGR